MIFSGRHPHIWGGGLAEKEGGVKRRSSWVWGEGRETIRERHHFLQKKAGFNQGRVSERERARARRSNQSASWARSTEERGRSKGGPAPRWK